MWTTGSSSRSGPLTLGHPDRLLTCENGPIWGTPQTYPVRRPDRPVHRYTPMEVALPRDHA